MRALTIWIHEIYAALRNRIEYTHEQKSSKQEGDVAGTYKTFNSAPRRKCGTTARVHCSTAAALCTLLHCRCSACAAPPLGVHYGAEGKEKGMR